MAEKSKIALPNIWGEGILFAFSGFDDKTDLKTELVATTLPDKPGFKIRFPYEALFYPCIFLEGKPVDGFPSNTTFTLICNDVIDMMIISDSLRIRIQYTAVNNETIAGKISCELMTGKVAVELVLQSEKDGLIAGFPGGGKRQESDKPFTAIFTLSNGGSSEFDFDAEFAKRAAFLQNVPIPKKCDEKTFRTLLKCYSVLKVNLHSLQGSFKNDWMTPDRYPHRNMWLWDSAFEALGLRYLSREKAESCIRAVLSRQSSNGFIPHMMTPYGDDSKITQPPLLCWATWRLFDSGSSMQFIESIFPKLVKYLKRYLTMDKNENGLLEWVEGGQESGMDNSPRFDNERQPDAIDLNSFVASELFYLGKIAAQLHESSTVEYCRKKREFLSKRINSMLWDEKDGLYYDLDTKGKLINVKTCACFTPLFAGIAPPERVKRLVANLTNPEEFNRAFPVSSTAATEPSFCGDMWRGPAWANYNLIIIEGLRRHNMNKEADYIAKRTVEEIVRWYEREGVIFEYYDSEGKSSPRELIRKGKAGGDWIHTCVKDYSWTAAVFVELVMNS